MNDRPTVYVPHLLTQLDPIAKIQVPAINLKPAADYGDINVLTNGIDAIQPETFADTVDKLRKGMIHMRDGDFIAIAGDTALCGVAISEGLKRFPKIKVLRWSHITHKYTIIVIGA